MWSKREVTHEANRGAACPHLKKTKKCNLEHCPTTIATRKIFVHELLLRGANCTGFFCAASKTTGLDPLLALLIFLVHVFCRGWVWLLSSYQETEKKTLLLCCDIAILNIWAHFFCIWFSNILPRWNNSCTHQEEKKQSLWVRRMSVASKKRMILVILPFSQNNSEMICKISRVTKSLFDKLEFCISNTCTLYTHHVSLI